jgi:hypothetical protein
MAELQAALGRVAAGAAPVPTRAELDGLIEACTATRVIDVRAVGPAGGGAGRTLPLYAPAGAEAETHTVGRVEGGAPAVAPTPAAAPGPASAPGPAPAHRPSVAVIVVSALGFLVLASVIFFLVPGPSSKPAAPPVVAPLVVATPAATPAAALAAAAAASAPASAAVPAMAAVPGAPAPAAASRVRAHLSVQVVPWAKVYLDGALVGETPIERDLGPGAHTLRLVNDGLGKDERVPLRLKAGEKKTIRRRWKAAE